MILGRLLWWSVCRNSGGGCVCECVCDILVGVPAGVVVCLVLWRLWTDAPVQWWMTVKGLARYISNMQISASCHLWKGQTFLSVRGRGTHFSILQPISLRLVRNSLAIVATRIRNFSWPGFCSLWMFKSWLQGKKTSVTFHSRGITTLLQILRDDNILSKAYRHISDPLSHPLAYIDQSFNLSIFRYFSLSPNVSMHLCISIYGSFGLSSYGEIKKFIIN